MPAYVASTASLPIDALYPGDSGLAYNAEQPATGTKSKAFNLTKPVQPFGNNPQQAVSIEVSFASAPGVFSLQVQTADTDVDGAYQSETFGGATPGVINAVTNLYARVELLVVAKFIRILTATQNANGVNMTVKITR